MSRATRREFLKEAGTAMLGTAVAGTGLRGQTPVPREFDFIVIGAGAAGCVIANRLSADAATRVLLVEAGGADSAAAIDAPGKWTTLLGTNVDWNYETSPTPAMGSRSIRWPRGKVLGGSSAISAMAYVRGHKLSFADWAAAAGPEWGYDALLPLFKRIEDNARGASEFHGAGNAQQRVSDQTDPHAGHLAFLEAARERGFGAGATWDFNGAQQENGAGFYQKTIKDGRRHSAAHAFLAPVMSRPNLTVWTETATRRITTERGRAIGIECERAGAATTVRASRGVILSAGVIGTPKLLMLSGMGPADDLRRHNIAIVSDLPEVGRNLHDHPRVPVRWQAKSPLAPSSVSAGLLTWSGANRRGPGAPNLQFYVGRGIDTPDPFVTLTVALSRPMSRGRLALASADPTAAPSIEAGYFSDARDLDALVAGVRLAREIAGSAAYTAIRGAATDPGDELRTDDELRAYVRRVADTMFHPAGTCRMGRDNQSVVDPQLRVRGVGNLWIADASIMPVCVNSQTQAACSMIGERAAELIK